MNLLLIFYNRSGLELGEFIMSVVYAGHILGVCQGVLNSVFIMGSYKFFAFVIEKIKNRSHKRKDDKK